MVGFFRTPRMLLAVIHLNTNFFPVARAGRAFRPEIVDGVVFSTMGGASKSGENHRTALEQPVSAKLGKYRAQVAIVELEIR